MLDGIAELDPIVSKHGVDLVGDGVDKSLQKAGGGTDVRLTMQLGEGELARAVDGYEQVEFGLIGSHLSDVDMDVADRVSLERLFGLVAFDFGQPLMPCRWRLRCREERVKCGIVALSL